uniref:Major facilitator superfamily (MFS) profile domain-containing protein n=1 Tax=Clastoptera arizonana TaxID=38151 RepID=A0A1B6ECS3_9HEMI
MFDKGVIRQYIAGFTACCSVLVAGTCFGWVAPILKNLIEEGSEIPMTASQSSWMISIIEAGNLLSPIPAGMLSDRWGRKPLILATGPLYFISWIIILYYHNFSALCLSRVLQGIALGISITVVPIYISEISSPRIRGSISSLFHNSWYLGHLIEYCMGPFMSYRTFTYATATIPVIFMIMFFWQPESPYYLLMKKKNCKAAQALLVLRGKTSTEYISEELEVMRANVDKVMKYKPMWKDLVATPADRKAILIIVVLGGVRVMSGALAIMTYMSQTFSKMTTTDFTPHHITIIIGAFMFVTSFFSTVIVDISGRRPLIFISSLGAGITLFLAGGYFYLDKNTHIDVSKYNLFPAVIIIIYSLFVTSGLGPVSLMYQSELFLSNTRGLASSISALNLTVWSFLVLKFYQVIDDSIGVFLIYLIFSTSCFFGCVFIYFIAPETKGKTFAEIREEMIYKIEIKRKRNNLQDNINNPI